MIMPVIHKSVLSGFNYGFMCITCTVLLPSILLNILKSLISSEKILGQDDKKK